MPEAHRSLCPINLSLEVFGDRWTLLVLRDIMFGGRRHFRELLTCEEGIASNILADRLSRLLEMGLIRKDDDPSHKQKAIYSLTEKGIQLVPVLAEIASWGRRNLPAGAAFSARAAVLEQPESGLRRRFMDELRTAHLGKKRHRSRGPSVAELMQSAYDEAESEAEHEDTARGRPLRARETPQKGEG